MTCSVLRSPSRVAPRVFARGRRRRRRVGRGVVRRAFGDVCSVACSVACSAAWFPVQQKKRRLPVGLVVVEREYASDEVLIQELAARV